jgi:hypothetical protein
MDCRDFTNDRDATGIDAAVAALQAVASQAELIVTNYYLALARPIGA